MAKRNRWGRIIFETDVELVFKGVQRQEYAPWQLTPIVEDIRASKMFFAEMSLSLVRHEANRFADWIACQSKKGMCCLDWVEIQSFPLFLLLERDSLSVDCNEPRSMVVSVLIVDAS